MSSAGCNYYGNSVNASRASLLSLVQRAAFGVGYMMAKASHTIVLLAPALQIIRVDGVRSIRCEYIEQPGT